MSPAAYAVSILAISIALALHNMSRRSGVLGSYPLADRSPPETLLIMAALWPALLLAVALPFFHGFVGGVACAIGGLIGGNVVVFAAGVIIGAQGMRSIRRPTVLAFAAATIAVTALEVRMIG